MEVVALVAVVEGERYRSEQGGSARRVGIPQSHPWNPRSRCCPTPGAWPSSTNWKEAPKKPHNTFSY